MTATIIVEAHCKEGFEVVVQLHDPMTGALTEQCIQDGAATTKTISGMQYIKVKEQRIVKSED